MTELLSDHLTSTRDAFKRHAHGGKRFSSDEILGLVERLDELIAIALSQENEVSRHQWNEAAQVENIDHKNCRCMLVPLRPAHFTPASNVIFFPGMRREQPRSPDGGGNAA